MRVVFLDIDGVMNRTGFQPEDPTNLRSWIEPELAARLSEVLHRTSSLIVLSSDWRVGRTREYLLDEMHAAGIGGVLRDVTPVLRGRPRWAEIQAWLNENEQPLERSVIVDDGFDMGPLHPRFVQTSPLNGLDDVAARAIERLFARG